VCYDAIDGTVTQMSEIFDEAARVAKEAVPLVLCGAGGLSRLGQDIAGKVNPFYSGSLLEQYQSGVTKALQGFCPIPADGAPVYPDQQFEGGQCAGVNYRVDYERGSSGSPLSTFASYPGPIGNVTGPIPSGSGYVWRSTYGPSATPWNLHFSFSTADQIARITSVSRTDGAPDTCGDPPPVFPPGTPTPNPPNPPSVDVEIDLPGIGPVTVALTPIVGIVYVDANAEFNVPVTVNVDVGGIDVNFDLDFDVNISDPTKPPKPAPPNRPKDPDDRVDPPDCPPPSVCINEPEEDEPAVEPPPVDPKEFRVVGAASLCVVDLSMAVATEILQENGPNIWAPRLGYIRFQYVTNLGETVWGTDIAVKGTNFVTGAPDVGLKCVGAVLNTERGVGGELILLKKKVTAGCC